MKPEIIRSATEINGATLPQASQLLQHLMLTTERSTQGIGSLLFLTLLLHASKTMPPKDLARLPHQLAGMAQRCLEQIGHDLTTDPSEDD